MLLDFRVKNYKSFKNEARLNLIPDPKQKDLEYSVIKKMINNKEYKGLSTAVLYGPNAAGKTNLIDAVDTLIQLVNRGHINNDKKTNSLNVSSINLEFIPNSDYLEATPVEFYIYFIKEGNLFEYHLKLNLGTFLDVLDEREVLEERLVVNGIDEFKRINKQVTLSNEYKEAKNLETLLTSNLRDTELFVSNGYKNIVNNFIYNEFFNYLKNDVVILNGSDDVSVDRRADFDKDLVKDNELSKVANEIGAINNKINLSDQKNDGSSELTSFFERENENVSIPSHLIESRGTIRFLNLYPIIKRVLLTGGVLIVDEFASSIHPVVLLEVVNIFHNDEINVNKAQLIFNTHNPIFLNDSILRRDEIKFVEVDENGSNIYSLADFQSSGNGGIETNDDHTKNYFSNKYGAIPDVNLSTLLSYK